MIDDDIIILQAIAKLLEYQITAEEVYLALLGKIDEKHADAESSWEWQKFFDYVVERITGLQGKKDED